MRFTKLHSGVLPAFFLSLQVVSAQTNRTWTGSMNMDWFNPGNWSPAGVPASNDIVNLTNGTIVLTAPAVTIERPVQLDGRDFEQRCLGDREQRSAEYQRPGHHALSGKPADQRGHSDLEQQLHPDCGLWLRPLLRLIENLAGGLFDIRATKACPLQRRRARPQNAEYAKIRRHRDYSHIDPNL